MDVVGYFVDGTVVDPGGVTALAPYRLLDSGLSRCCACQRHRDGHGCRPRRRACGGVGGGGEPHGRDARGAGYLTAYPTGAAAPNTSNVNFTAGQVANLAFVKLAAWVVHGAERVGGQDSGGRGRRRATCSAARSWGPGCSCRCSPARVLDTRPAYGGSGPIAGYAAADRRRVGRGAGDGCVGGGASTSRWCRPPPWVSHGVPGGRDAVPLASNLNFRRGQVGA